MSLPSRWAAVLDRLRAEGRYRELSLPQGVDLASNDYLGYGNRARIPCAASSPPLQFRMRHESPRSGMASRLLRGHQEIWNEVEAALARWHGAEAALVMTSGYGANEGLLSTVIEPQDWVASDALNHASIIDGLRLASAERFVYGHLDLDHLEAGLRAVRCGASLKLATTGQRQLFVVTESLFGMDGDLAVLDQLVPLAERYGASVIVDEAHSTGCFGPAGSGCVDAAGLRARVLATVHTGGKALGVAGAYICGSALLRELLINRCRHFMFTTALPAALGTWWLDALRRVQADHAGRTALHEAAATFRRQLARHGVPALGSHYIVPVVLGEDIQAVHAAGRLRHAGWDIRAIRPPSVPSGSARLRISIHADHPQETLIAAAAAIAEAAGSTGDTGSAFAGAVK
jgi:8-amino-7-oxononanoate synthase